MESTNSDYDVRFIYIRPRDYYLRVDLEYQRDVIEIPITTDLDVNGWDMKKALGLMYKSNPPLIEWLTSDIVYRDTLGVRKDLTELAVQFFSPERVLKHYLHMADNNYRRYLQREDGVEIKKYFYVLRPLLACDFVERHQTLPPVSLPRLIELEMPDGKIKEECLRLLEIKKSGEELGVAEPIKCLDDFLHHKINHFKKLTKMSNTVPSFDDINSYFRYILNLNQERI